MEVGFDHLTDHSTILYIPCITQKNKPCNFRNIKGGKFALKKVGLHDSASTPDSNKLFMHRSVTK
jgi:hypothetical protein